MYQQQDQPERNLPARSSGNIKDLNGLLERHKNQFAMVLPKTLSVDRLMRIVISTVTINPKLLQCDQKSFLRSILQSASLGLEPGGPLGLAHLVPFWNSQRNQLECQLIVDYKGYIELARRGGDSHNVYAKIVYENEEFSMEEGTAHTMSHKPLPPSKRGEKKIGAYAVFKDRDGKVLGWDFVWAEEIEATKEKVLANKKNTGMNPWVTNEEAMWKKTPVRRLAKWVRLSPEMQKAAIMEENQEAGIEAKLDVDLDLGETPPATDAEQKTGQKTDALKEKLRQQQLPQQVGGAVGGSGNTAMGMQQELAKQEAEAEDITVYPVPPTDEETPTLLGGPVTPDPGSDGDQGAQEEEPPPPPPPPERQAETAKAAEKKKAPPAKARDTIGPSTGPRIEAGHKAADYWLDAARVKCPPGGGREGAITAITHCNQGCQFRKRCFLFTD